MAEHDTNGSETHRTGPTPQPATDMTLGWVRLHDIQGLYGGRAIYIRDNGTALVRVVEPGGPHGMAERRFEGLLSPEQLSELGALLQEHSFMTLEIPDRPGVPDEARAVLTVHLASGDEHTVAKWDNDRQYAHFNAIYGWLMARADELAAGEPIFTGPYDWQWEPDGFVPQPP